MKLYKDDILKLLKSYDIDYNECIILSGASLVLQGVKEYTSDIDISVSDKVYHDLLKKYSCTLERIVDNDKVWFIDDIINFSKNYYDKVEFYLLDGYKIQTIESILELKRELGRQKDMEDIKHILEYERMKK